MAQVELIMPKMGESIMEATILKWLKNPGKYSEFWDCHLVDDAYICSKSDL